MSSSSETPSENHHESPKSISKKAAKKEAVKQEKQQHRPQKTASANASLEDKLSANYGKPNKVSDVESWTAISSLTEELKDEYILLRGQIHTIRAVSKKMAFLVVRERRFSVQCIVSEQSDLVSRQMVKYVVGLSRESIIDIEGIVSVPDFSIKGATQPVEIQVRKLYCISKPIQPLSINVEDAARSETEIEKASQTGEKLVRVNQDTRLNNRVLDLRTPANQAIFNIKFQVESIFREFLSSEGFIGIHTPKTIVGSSEGGASVFKLNYMGQPACLAQSPQLHKQMIICGGFERVFEVGPVFRAENSFTHRHLCEFTGLDVEMTIKTNYFEVMDIVDRLFVSIFDRLNKNYKEELEAVNKQYPFKPLKYLRKTPRFTFEEGVKMLKDAGVEIDPLGDLNTQAERKLGQLVLEKYDTEFYILHRYPLAVRPFYTMPFYDNPTYSNSFDAFIRGEEIISGSERVNELELLTNRARACGIDVETKAMEAYLKSFNFGVPPHGGFGAGLERVVMLFLGLNNIRKTSLFPRDPQRLTP